MAVRRLGRYFFLDASTRAADSRTRRANLPIVLRFADQRFVRAQNEIFVMAYQAKIASGADVPDRYLFDRGGREDTAHLQIVRTDQGRDNQFFRAECR